MECKRFAHRFLMHYTCSVREFELLKHIYRASTFADDRVLIGPGDDMGMVRLSGRELLAAVDQLIDGRHVQLHSTPIELVGRKAMTRSLSDIAAMAAKPVASLASATLPVGFESKLANTLFDSMRNTASEFGCPLIGGDLAIHSDSRAPLICSVTVLAEPAGFPPITRGGAKPGDAIYVTGRLGGSLDANGLGHHLTFTPQIHLAIELGTALGGRLHAMLDISDGLGRDVSHMAELSNVRIELDADKVPCNPGCDWKRALADGEDYELCFAAIGDVPARIGDVPITLVGRVLPPERPPSALVLIRAGHQVISGGHLGWEHHG